MIKVMNSNKLKMGSILSYVSLLVGYIISIIYTPIMLNLLGKSEYGLYNLVSSVVSYLGLLSFGFGSAYMRYYSRYKVNNDDYNIAKLNGMFLIVYTCIGIITILFGTVLIQNIDFILGNSITKSELETAKILMNIMILNMATTFVTSVFNSNIIANEEYIFQKLLYLLKTIINPFIIIPVLLMGYRSVGMVIATTIINISIELVNIIFCYKKLNIKFCFKKFDFKLMKEMAIFSSFIFLNMIIDQINWNVDKFILGRFRGTSDVAIYGLAAQLNTYYLSLSTSLSSVFIPRVNRMVALYNDNKELTKLFTRVGRIQFIILSLICSGFIFYGQTFINLWAGQEYKDAYFIVILLIVPVTIPLIQNLGIEIQRAKNMHQFRSWVYLFIAIANVFISIPLARLYGGVGSAIGTAVSLIIGNGIIMNWYYHKKVKIDIIYFWKEILKFTPSLIIPLAVGIISNIFIDLTNLYLYLACGFIYTVVFCLSMWLLGMNMDERKLISIPLIKILNRSKLRIKLNN